VARIGVLNISDGRDYVHEGIADFILANEDKLVARLDVPVDVFLSRFGANHVHAVPGDKRAELRAVCELLDITLDEFTRG
jgi:L-fucose isomerase-like protein